MMAHQLKSPYPYFGFIALGCDKMIERHAIIQEVAGRLQHPTTSTGNLIVAGCGDVILSRFPLPASKHFGGSPMSSSRTWFIYTLSDPRTHEVRYVGVTFRLRQRFTEHVSRAQEQTTYKANWIKQLLREELRPILTVVDQGTGNWVMAEQNWINYYRNLGARLTNLTDGGEGTPGYVPSEELRGKWRKQRRGKTYKGIRPGGMTGKTHSASARAKIAEAGRNRKHTEESRAKLSAQKKGKPLPMATVQASITVRLGRPLTEEHKSKIAATTKNRKPVECIETGEQYASITAVARVLGVTESSVYQALRKGSRCKGYHWRFVKDDK